IVAGSPDFPERVAAFLRNLAETHPVEILILADPENPEAFDEVGRPRIDWFSTAPIEVPDSALKVCKDVGEANGRIAHRLEVHPDSRTACVCGVGMPADGAALTFELESRGLPAYDPAGLPFGATDAGRFFRHLTGICFGEEIPDLVAWIRDPYVARWMKSSGERTDRESWIRETDQWLEKILPNSIEDFFAVVLQHRLSSRILARTQAIRRTAREVGHIFALVEHRDLRPLLAEVESSEGVSEFASSLAGIRHFSESMGRPQDLEDLGRWAIEESMKFPIYPERPPEAIEVLGWLELLWEEKPWLQIPDFYDGSVPGMIGSHPLLPESLRQILKIPGRAYRDARDAYILNTLVKLRKENGTIDLYVPGRDLAGSVVSPSRLLYFTPTEDLPQRVQILTEEPATPLPAASVAPLRIDPSPVFSVENWWESLTRIHVTSFASWIRCPFTFYLERVANMSSVDPDRLEMDPGAFGTGLHEVMRQLDDPGSPEVDWQDREAIESRADHLLDKWFTQQFGPRPGLLLELQREGLRRRVHAAARIRAEARLEGWKPILVEWSFRDEGLLSIRDIPISGQIDLVEEREEELRIVDYKTSEKATPPEDAHIADLSRRRVFTPSALLPVDGRSGYGWTNLQLPLYYAALRAKFPNRPIRLAYGQLPRAMTESKLAQWPDFESLLADSALRAAETVVDLWRQKGFWPPSSHFKQSDAFSWSGPDGEDTWQHGDLLNLSELLDSQNSGEEVNS
ncbi:MAG: PD-(D/E)XK nuclease family protein, partial [Puniceicoccales bacterium]